MARAFSQFELFSIDHDSPLPLHVQVENMLRTLINEPEYQDGQLLPNEVDIAKRLGISRNTVRQGVNKLVYEQLLTRKKGVGTRVARNKITTKLNKWSSFTHEMHEKGIEFVNYDIHTEWVVPEPYILGLFGLTSPVKLLKLVRLRGLDTGPIVHFSSWFHPRIGLTGEEDFTKPLYEMLERDYHTVVAVSKEEIGAALADPAMARILHMEAGDPVLVRKRLVCDPGDRLIEYNLGYYRGDQFTYGIDIAR